MKNDFQMFLVVPRGPTFFCRPSKKNSKIQSFVLEWWFLHVNRSVFHQEMSRKSTRVPRGSLLYEKMANILSEFSTQKIGSWFWHELDTNDILILNSTCMVKETHLSQEKFFDSFFILLIFIKINIYVKIKFIKIHSVFAQTLS